MSRLKLGKPQKALVAIIESEGAEILSIEKGGNHLKVNYTFDQHHVFTQPLPYGTGTLDHRWASNMRATVRKNKRHLEN